MEPVWIIIFLLWAILGSLQPQPTPEDRARWRRQGKIFALACLALLGGVPLLWWACVVTAQYAGSH